MVGADLLITLFHDDVHKEKDAVLSVKDLQVELERRQDNHDLRSNLLINLRNGYLVQRVAGQAGRKKKQPKLYFKLEGDHGMLAPPRVQLNLSRLPIDLSELSTDASGMRPAAARVS
eukprot:1801845-Rhodomonas_salina.6